MHLIVVDFLKEKTIIYPLNLFHPAILIIFHLYFAIKIKYLYGIISIYMRSKLNLKIAK